MYTAMPLREHKINLTSGVHTGDVIHCEEDGDIKIVWRSESPDTTYSMLATDDRGLPPTIKSVEIISGVFSIG